MKGLKWSLAVTSTALLIIGLSGIAFAFHSGGVAECEGCHSMHSAQSGALLTKSDIGSTCLNCHENADGDTGPNKYHISTRTADLGAGAAPLQRTPGGDFGWLKKTFSWLGRDGVTTETEDGSTHGHNIIAIDNGYTVVDGATAPGGTFPADLLTCTSCHDMHGQYRRFADGTINKTGLPTAGSGSYHNSTDPVDGATAVGVYRLLAGKDFTQNGTGVSFAVDPPAVVVNGTYNASEAALQVRTAYGKGMAEWCATCHPDMHSTSGRLVHPVSQPLGLDLWTNYNNYVKSGDLTGVVDTSFTSLVPYEEDSTNYTDLKAIASNSAKLQPGPASDTAQVMCLSCHRAHASGWPESLRWAYQAEFIVYNGLYPGTDNSSSKYARGRTAAETQAAYYDRDVSEFATYQRVLCNKCHAKD
jgi:predicted CXXCH cytochrome family protein